MTDSDLYHRDKAIVLFKRRKSPIWQARLKIGKGKGSWNRISTGETDIKKAKEVAGREYDKRQFRKELGLVPVSKTFESIALTTIDELKLKLQTGNGKVIYEDYIRSLRKYFIPFFGRKSIDDITPTDLSKFNIKREEILGKIPAKSTIRNHNASMRMVFNTALQHGWIKQHQIPKLITPSTAEESKVRPYFSKQEYHDMYTCMENWCKPKKGDGLTQKTKELRELLYDYVRICINSGMRPGTETHNLKWSDISFGYKKYGDKKKRKYIKMYVEGKTGGRNIVVRDNTWIFLRNIASRFPELKDISKKKLHQIQSIDLSMIDEYVFRLRNGERPKDLNRPFKKCLEDCGLLEDNRKNIRTLYSLRHSYITWGLLEGISIHLLAEQCGTSIQMIEKHYSHVIPELQADILAGWSPDVRRKTKRDK